ncbi:MAG: glycosyltransferase family 2 protein [Planctomycetota bacterium]|nr:glycosyltransferase family 2 protein [Planctomycetota bacterium]
MISWNTSEVLKNCLYSVFEQREMGETEVFVVDNASTDGSANMVRCTFPSVRLISNDRNRGFGAANNQAIQLSSGRYVLLLNSDTIVLSDVLPKSIAYMDHHPNVGIMGCRVLNADCSVQRTCMRYPSLLNVFLSATGLSHLRWPAFCGREHMRYWQRDDERDVDVISGCYMLVRRTAIDQVGLLDESFFFCGEESDWCRRFRQAGWKLRFAPVGEIVHLGNVSGRKHGYQRDVMLSEGLVRFLRKHDGLAVATLSWVMLWVFNFSHFLVWYAVSFITRSSSARERSAHFLAVSRDFGTAWPRLNSEPR